METHNAKASPPPVTVPLSPEFLHALNAANVTAAIVELADTVSAAVQLLGWPHALFLSNRIKSTGNALLREIALAMSASANLAEESAKVEHEITDPGAGRIVLPGGDL